MGKPFASNPANRAPTTLPAPPASPAAAPAPAVSPTQIARFTEALAHAQTALFHFARGLVGEAELARDLVQDAFLDAWRGVARGEAPFDAASDEIAIRRWLFTVVYRAAAKVHRRRRLIAWESLDADPLAGGPHLPPQGAFEDRVAEAAALQAALRTLDPQDAACFLLQAVYGFSTAEIAAIVGAQPDALRKRLSRAKQRLRAAYTGQAGGDGEAHV